MKKNLNLYAFIVVMILFTIGFFSTAFNSSYAFPTGNENDSYENRIHLIEKSAQLYAENNPDLFANTENIYVTVDELVDLGYIYPDDETGAVKDPSSDVKVLNDLKIRVTKKGGEITTKVLS